MEKKIYVCEWMSPLGKMVLGSDRDALLGAWFFGQTHFMGKYTSFETAENLAVFRETKRWLRAYFCGENPDITVKLKPEGTGFRKSVWQQIQAIPYGETVTYGEIAHHLGKACARAVGGAVGENPISVLIPCHRVIGANAALCGYAGGKERKRALLMLENPAEWR